MVIITQALSVSRGRALIRTAAFPSDLTITNQTHLIYPKFPEREASSQSRPAL